jgi:predicted nucleic acid-binding protein
LIVVDTNLIVALAIKTAESGLAEAVQRRDQEWIAPALWESEFRNVLVGLMRAGVIGQPTALAAHKFALETVQSHGVATSAVLRLAETHGITAYDAEFAALAEWLEIPCLSFDEHLLKPGLAVHPKAF